MATFWQMPRHPAFPIRPKFGFVSLVGDEEVTLMGRHGIGVGKVPRDIAFCAHTITGTEPFIVADLAADTRFKDNPLVEKRRAALPRGRPSE